MPQLNNLLTISRFSVSTRNFAMLTFLFLVKDHNLVLEIEGFRVPKMAFEDKKASIVIVAK